MMTGFGKPRCTLSAVVTRADGRVENLGVIADSEWSWFRRSVIERIRRWYMRRFLRLG